MTRVGRQTGVPYLSHTPTCGGDADGSETQAYLLQGRKRMEERKETRRRKKKPGVKEPGEKRGRDSQK